MLTRYRVTISRPTPSQCRQPPGIAGQPGAARARRGPLGCGRWTGRAGPGWTGLDALADAPALAVRKPAGSTWIRATERTRENLCPPQAPGHTPARGGGGEGVQTCFGAAALDMQLEMEGETGP